jgi:stalled ribosome rescue protein Dom34
LGDNHDIDEHPVGTGTGDGMTSGIFHLVVWIDHEIARLYAFTKEGAREIAAIHAPNRDTGHIHHKAGTPGPGHAPVAQDFLERVATGLQQAEQILIIGPADVKNALKTHLEHKWPSLVRHIIGVEPMQKASESEIHAFARRFFLRADHIPPSEN